MMLEGFGYGRANNEGYNNPYDYKPGMSIDILIMGSSHVEGFYVMPKDIPANLLASMSGRTVYNIGTGGHYFHICADNLEAAARKYNPSQYIVIETHTTSFSDEVLHEILQHAVPKEGVGKKSIIRRILRQSPYVRFLSWKFKAYIDRYFSASDTFSSGFNNPQLLSDVLLYMKNTAAASGAKVIVLYRPRIKIENDGRMIVQHEAGDVERFSRLCSENEIYFLDMSKRFLEDYAKDYTIPYGFFNTSLGSGHTNRYGTKMFAEEIYSLIQRIEAES